MNRGRLLWLAGAPALLAACASVNPPLVFGDTATFGLQLGTNSATGGANVTLGYKQHSVAVVPVSVLDEKNSANALRGYSDTGKDALSVFAVFESTADGANPNARTVKVGQIFSTGSAAQLLTQGMCNKVSGGTACPFPAAESPGAAAKAAAAAKADTGRAAASGGQAQDGADKAVAAGTGKRAPAEAPTADAASDRPYQWPLIYARTDVFGFDIGGSSSEQGAVFTLGYSTRNLALVPVYAPSAGGRATGLLGDRDTSTNTHQDAYSVLGQFDAATQTTALGYGLKRYFSTGIAAQNLSRGLGRAIATDEPQPKDPK